MQYRTPIYRLQIVKEGSIRQRPAITSTTIGRRFAYDIIEERGEPREVFVVVALDVKNRPMHIEIATTGTVDASLVHPREVFRMAIEQGASSVLLIHNHPSGDPSPSEPDRDVTKRLREAGAIIGIRVVDHIIVGDDGETYSFAENGWQ